VADKDVRIDITVDSDIRGAAKAAKAVEEVRKESDKLDGSFKKSGTSAKKLTQELKELQTQRRSLAEKIGSGDADADDRREFNRINQRIGWLKKLRAATRVADKTGENAMGSALDMGGEGMKPRNAGIAGVVAAGVVGSPAWGALLAGMLSGTVVGVAMAGGILSAIKEPSVKAAASGFGSEISKEFFSGGKTFAGPVIESLGILQRDFQSLNLGDAFAKTAPFVTTLARGIGDLAKNMMPGFNKLLEKAGPYTEVFAQGLAGLGTALGSFMDDVSASPGALQGLYGGLALLNGTIIVLGRTLYGLSEAFSWIIQKNAEWTGVAEDIPLIGGLFSGLNDVMENVAGSANIAAVSTERYGYSSVMATSGAKGLAAALKATNDAFKDYYGIQASVDDTTIAANMSLLELKKTLQENKGHWEDNTQAGLENQQQLRSTVDALKAKRDAAVEAAGDDAAAIVKANREYDKAIRKIKEMATNAGITEEKFNDLAGTYTITFFLQQKAGAEVVAWSTLRNIERTSGGGKAKQGSASGLGYQGFASGGTTPANTPFWVGENGPELRFSDRQQYVATAAQSNAMRSGGGGGTQHVDLTLRVVHATPDGRVLRTELINDALNRGQSEDLVSAAYP
jgi:hypothetical protein